MGGCKAPFRKNRAARFLFPILALTLSCTNELKVPDQAPEGTPCTLYAYSEEWLPENVRSSYSDATGINLSRSENIALFYNDGSYLVGVDDSNRYPYKATANGDGTWTFTNPAAASGKTWYAFVPYSQQAQRYMKTSTNAQSRIGPVQFPGDDTFDPQADLLAGQPFIVGGNTATISCFKRLVAPWRIFVTGLESSDRIYAATLTLSGTASGYATSIGGIMTISTSESYDGVEIIGTTGGNTRSLSVQYPSGQVHNGSGHPLWFMVHPVPIVAGTTLTLKVTTADETYTRTAFIPSDQELRTDKINKLTFNIKGADYIKEETVFQDFTAQALAAGSKTLEAADGSSLTWNFPASPQWTSSAGDGGSGYPNAFGFSTNTTLTIPTISGKNITGLRLFFHPCMTWSGGGVLTLMEGETSLSTINGACLVTASSIPGAIERGGWVDVALPDGRSTLGGLKLKMTGRKGLFTGAILFTEDSSTSDIVSTCTPWNDFASGSLSNVLPDFSYAGYDHGRSAPPNVWELGYDVYNVCDYGAVPDDGLNDRAALISCLTAAFGSDPVTDKNNIRWNVNSNARKIIYFPAGEYILYDSSDTMDRDGDGLQDTQRIYIVGAANFILKGAGKNRTRLVINAPLQPTDPSSLYSSMPLFCLAGYNIDSASDARMTNGALISANASKGDFSVSVESNKQAVAAGDWVCLRAHVSDTDFINAEVDGLSLGDSWDINVSGSGAGTGWYIREYHQVASVSGTTITFVEPLMHDIDASFNFYIPKFAHCSGIGVEDLTFVGQQGNGFVHHGSWADDGAYKPLSFYYITDSWLRRCGFENVSEIATMNMGANNSMYDISLSGWRGHNNARVANQSFSFVGKVTDTSNGPVQNYNPVYAKDYQLTGAGSFHGPGVAVWSCGNVFWRCTWGKDAGFESHGSQSRNTLFDCCEGGFLSRRQGGGTDDMPNHLGGLVFWNFNALNAWDSFDWWSSSTAMYVVKPVLVGMHGSTVTSAAGHVTTDYSNGSAVDIESLYEAQLQRRLGNVPAWLEQLK